MNSLKVQIVVPVYNAAKYLRECLDSIKEQTYTNWEAILVDDASKDNSSEIIKEYTEKDSRFIYVPLEKNYILTKDSFLTDEEKDEMTEHTRLGFEAVEDVLFEDEYEIIKNICLYHHERADGKGYEQKTDIPLYVQIVSICDAYDALTSDRIYRAGMSRDEAMALITGGRCGYFDDHIVEYLKLATE